MHSVELIAISKYQSSELIREAAEAGQTAFGENYAQELAGKQSALSDIKQLSWHFTGHLQSNKAKTVVGNCDLIRSVDSAKIAGTIARIAKRLGIVQDILIEVNLGADSGKTGVAYEKTLELCDTIGRFENIRARGLMTIAPEATRSSHGAARESFARLKQLFDMLPTENRTVLSMGMSDDFEDAIAEGATMVRIGTALFGPRPV